MPQDRTLQRRNYGAYSLTLDHDEQGHPFDDHEGPVVGWTLQTALFNKPFYNRSFFESWPDQRPLRLRGTRRGGPGGASQPDPYPPTAAAVVYPSKYPGDNRELFFSACVTASISVASSRGSGGVGSCPTMTLAYHDHRPTAARSVFPVPHSI